MFPRKVTLLVAMLLAAAVPARGQSIELQVVATTDVHGRVRGWDYFADTVEAARGLTRAATVIDSVRKANPAGTIVLDAGDFLQGNPLAYIASRPAFRGANPIVAAMNAIRYDAVVLGNHEFNYGLATLDRSLSTATFPVIAANVRRLDGKPGWPPMVWLDRAGVRVAVIGETTPWSMVWDHTLLEGKLEIADIVSDTRRAVAEARAAGADVVIVLAHAGLSGSSAAGSAVPGVPPEDPMAEVARQVPGIDLIVFGHTHREVADTTINGVLLVQPRNWATSVSVAALRLERDGGSWKVAARHGTIVRVAGHAEKKSMVTLVARAHAAARTYANTTIGRTAVAWSTDSSRTSDTPIIDFIGETMRRATHADLASTAVFSTDVHMRPGPITVARLAQLYPYDNTLRVLRLSGAQLKAYLEQSARYYKVTGEGAGRRAAPDPTIIGFNFEVVTGADYTVDLTRPPGDRIVALSVRGRAVTATDSFSIALTNYRASGTGGYGMLVGATVVQDDQREIRQLLIDEVTRRKTLNPSNYFTPSWRVVPAELAGQVQAALDRSADFEAPGRSLPAPAPGAASAAMRAVPSAAEGDAAIATNGTGARASVLRIISTNDFHGALEARPDGNAGLRGGAAQFATAIRRLERSCSGSCTSVLVDGGDEFQGTPASNLAFGRPIVALYNALGYAAAAIGNHDFDWGQDTLRARMREAHYGMLAANVTYADGRPVPWIRGDTIVERGGIRIGIIGLATVLTPTTTMARNVADLRFHRAASIVSVHARDLRARGADLVIVIAHAGASCGNGVCSGEMADLAGGASGIDAIVGGHTHTEFTAVVAGVPEMRSRSSGRAVAYLDLPVDRAARRGAEARIVYVGTDTLPPDPDIARIVTAATEPVRALAGRPVATVAETLRRSGAQYPLGNLIADSQRAAARADVAVMNNGGIRADLRAGPATYGSFFEIQPFGNMLVRVRVTGAELHDYLERVVRGRAPNAHVSGASMTYDPSRPAGQRIVALTVGGRPLDPKAEYTLAMSDFMATGGDGLSIPNMVDRMESLGVVDLDACIDYVKALPGGVVRADSTVRISAVP